MNLAGHLPQEQLPKASFGDKGGGWGHGRGVSETPERKVRTEGETERHGHWEEILRV